MRLNFTAEQLNLGKLLVLEEKHDLKLAEIKRLIGATSVRELKSGKTIETMDEYVQYVVYEAITTISQRNINDIRLYEVNGDTKSTLLAMRTDKFISAVHLTGEQFIQLHHNSEFVREIKQIRHNIGVGNFRHNKFMDALAKRNHPMKKIAAKSKALNALAADYGIADIDNLIASMSAIMKLKW